MKLYKRAAALILTAATLLSLVPLSPRRTTTSPFPAPKSFTPWSKAVPGMSGPRGSPWSLPPIWT